MSGSERVAPNLSPAALHTLFNASQVGRCVNSVTHDVNNLLGAIMAYGELVGLDEGLSKESHRMLAEMMLAIRKSSNLMMQLTAIAREERDVTSSVRWHEFINRALALRQYDIKVRQIALDVDAPENQALYVIDEPRMTRALLYVIANAMDAVAGQESRSISIALRVAEEAAEIVVNNSGVPIPEEQRVSIFEPMYTTKEGHAGLGLSCAKTYVEYHGGTLVYDAERGFIMTIPRETGLTTTQIG